MNDYVDLLMILGGESHEEVMHGKSNRGFMSRSRKALAEWDRHIAEEQYPHIVMTGHHSGYAGSAAIVENARSWSFLRGNDIPAEFLHAEQPLEYIKRHGETAPGSLDTLTNFIYAQPVIAEIEKHAPAARIGIITDDYHMERGLWSAKRVLGQRYSFVPLPTGYTERGRSLQEFLVRRALALDLFGIAPGDHEGFARFVNEQHPMYAAESGTIYGALLKLKKRVEK